MRPDGSGGLFLLLTESFAVRALVGSLAALVLVSVAVRCSDLRSSRARRLLVLAPVTAAVVAAVVSVGDAFLPRLWVATTQAGGASQLLDFLGESWFLTPQYEIDVLFTLWVAVAGVLLSRRAAGVVAVRRLLRRAGPPEGYGDLVPMVDRIAVRMGVRSPELLLLPDCPGGAFTARGLRPVVVVDPVVVDQLDQREVEGLLAHEIAHIRRRDNLVAGTIGVVRDLTFFLPPVHAAARWLRGEREESADELAARVTSRPGALASSILKTWEGSRGRAHQAVACAAVPSRLALAGGGAVVEHRVERLISVPERVSAWRRKGELALAAAVTAVTASAVLAVPAWMVTQYDAAGVAVGYLTPAPVAIEATEPAAFSTFRALTVPEDPGTSAALSAPAGALASVDTAPEARWGAAADQACPCVASRTELRDRALDGHRGAAAPAMSWGRAEAWELRSERAGARDARPLWTVSEPSQHVGVFIVGSVPSQQ